MHTYNIDDVKTQLYSLVEQAAKGESFIIAKAGKPMVQVIAVDPPVQKRRMGFMIGHMTVPTAEVFNTLGSEEIEAMFGGGDE